MSVETIDFPVVKWTIKYYARHTPTTLPGNEDRDTYVPRPDCYLVKIDMRSDTPIEGPEGNWRALAYFYPESVQPVDGSVVPIQLPAARLGIPEHFGEGFIVYHFYISQLQDVRAILESGTACCYYDGTKTPHEACIGQ
jgi:hypothetical protein